MASKYVESRNSSGFLFRQNDVREIGDNIFRDEFNRRNPNLQTDNFPNSINLSCESKISFVNWKWPFASEGLSHIGTFLSLHCHAQIHKLQLYTNGASAISVNITSQCIVLCPAHFHNTNNATLPTSIVQCMYIYTLYKLRNNIIVRLRR